MSRLVRAGWCRPPPSSLADRLPIGRLKLTFRGLRRGRYRLTLLELRANRAPLVIGHTTLVVS